MTAILNTLSKCSHYSFRILTPCRLFHFTTVNQLYSPAAIGIDNYLSSRKRTHEQFANFSDKFRSKMNDFVSDPKNMIFTEDLKNMVHMAEFSDLDLVSSMVKKFNTQNTEYRFGSFIFGPVVMRMFYYLNAPEQALKCFFEPANYGFFDQQVTFQILLDLLYKNEKYDDMYKVFEVVKEKQINMTKYPKYPVVLILAACYKQNTPKSFEYASKLWSDMLAVGTVPLRRSSSLFAGLALNQKAPHIALESISMQRQHYITIRNIKAKALAEMGRLDDALFILKQVLDVDKPEEGRKHTFFHETVESVKQAVEKSNKTNTLKEFQVIEKALRDRDLIDNQTLDQLVNNEISVTNKPQPPRGMPTTQLKRMPYGLRNRNVVK